MTSRDELPQLIERLEAHAELHDSLAQYDLEQAQWGNDLRKAAATLRKLAEQKPVATVVDNNQPGWRNIVVTDPHVTLDVGMKLFALPVAAPAQEKKP
jgi:hypothetical protein